MKHQEELPVSEWLSTDDGTGEEPGISHLDCYALYASAEEDALLVVEATDHSQNLTTSNPFNTSPLFNAFKSVKKFWLASAGQLSFTCWKRIIEKFDFLLPFLEGRDIVEGQCANMFLEMTLSFF